MISWITQTPASRRKLAGVLSNNLLSNYFFSPLLDTGVYYFSTSIYFLLAFLAGAFVLLSLIPSLALIAGGIASLWTTIFIVL